MCSEKNKPGLAELFLVFARVSVLTIGGGYVMFPLLKRSVVDVKGWISDEEMVDSYALGQSIPGIIAMNTATLIGCRRRGVAGAVCAAAGMAAPSVLIILAVAAFLTPYFDHPWVQKAFAGIRAAVVAMIGMAVWSVGKKAANSPAKILVALGAFAAIVLLHVSPIFVILAGGLLGLTCFKRTEKQ